MTREEVFETLNGVFQDVFDDTSITVNDNTTSEDIEDWDSLEHINLIAAVEQEFGMKFSMGQVVNGGYYPKPNPITRSNTFPTALSCRGKG